MLNKVNYVLRYLSRFARNDGLDCCSGIAYLLAMMFYIVITSTFIKKKYVVIQWNNITSGLLPAAATPCSRNDDLDCRASLAMTDESDDANDEVSKVYTEETSSCARKMRGELAEPTLVGEHKRIPKSDNSNDEVSKVYV
jgi:hypothetical protein